MSDFLYITEDIYKAFNTVDEPIKSLACDFYQRFYNLHINDVARFTGDVRHEHFRDRLRKRNVFDKIEYSNIDNANGEKSKDWALFLKSGIPYHIIHGFADITDFVRQHIKSKEDREHFIKVIKYFMNLFGYVMIDDEIVEHDYDLETKIPKL